MNIPNNLFLIGPMGAGKSTVGRLLAKKLHYEFFDTDHLIEQRSGVDLSWIFSVEGNEGIRKREQAIITEISQLNHIVMSTGGGSIVSESNRNSLSKRGFVIYLQTSKPEQFNRTERNRKHRPLLQVKDLENQIDSLMQERRPLYEEIADLALSTDGKNVNKVVDEILEIIS